MKWDQYYQLYEYFIFKTDYAVEYHAALFNGNTS